MYRSLASHYDAFMKDVPYAEWTARLADEIGLRARGRDVGCGTGKFTLALYNLGYDVMGSDPSPQMLSIAMQTAIEKGVPVKFIQQSAENLFDPRPLEFITANCDVVNYLRRPEQFFLRAYQSLAKGGVLLFDISTEYKIAEIIGERTFTDSTDEVTYIWENRFDKKKRRGEMLLTFFENDGSGKFVRSTEEQTWYAHSVEELTKKLIDIGFTVAVHGFLKNRPPKDKDDRVSFAAYKQE